MQGMLTGAGQPLNLKNAVSHRGHRENQRLPESCSTCRGGILNTTQSAMPLCTL